MVGSYLRDAAVSQYPGLYLAVNLKLCLVCVQFRALELFTPTQDFVPPASPSFTVTPFHICYPLQSLN